MIKGLRIFAALLMLVAAMGALEVSTGAVVSTVSAQTCGCGKPSCGGCLQGLRARRMTSGSVQEIYQGSANDPVIKTVYGPEVEIGVAGCATCEAAPAATCASCAPAARVACAPKCECQFCTLKVKKVEADTSCFELEQKEVCVPAVRLPWMKCCPPKRSRVRTVNVLKTKKGKKDICEYKWSVHEPEEPAQPEYADPAAKAEAAEEVKQPGGYPDPVTETTGSLELSDPADAAGDVPRPPLEK